MALAAGSPPSSTQSTVQAKSKFQHRPTISPDVALQQSVTAKKPTTKRTIPKKVARSPSPVTHAAVTTTNTAFNSVVPMRQATLNPSPMPAMTPSHARQIVSLNAVAHSNARESTNVVSIKNPSIKPTFSIAESPAVIATC